MSSSLFVIFQIYELQRLHGKVSTSLNCSDSGVGSRKLHKVRSFYDLNSSQGIIIFSEYEVSFCGSELNVSISTSLKKFNI